MDDELIGDRNQLNAKAINKAMDEWNTLIRPRSEPRLTHRLIAQELGVSPSYWSQMLAGIIRPSDALVGKLEDLFEEYGIEVY